MKRTPKPILCDQCHALTMSPIWFKKQWVCKHCLNDADYGSKEIQISNVTYQSGVLSWAN